MDVFKLGSRFYYSRLPKADQTVYRGLYDSWSEGKSEAVLNLPGLDFKTPAGTSLSQIVTAVIFDNPQIFHLETTQFSYQRYGSRVTVRATSVYSEAEYRELYGKLYAFVTKFVSGIMHLSERERVQRIHDYLAANIVYDRGIQTVKSQREIHTVVGALLNHRCVCDGYARAFRLLCDQAKISCIVISGQAGQNGAREPHAWNVVKLDGVPYQIDVTWDSQRRALLSLVQRNYFLCSDEAFAPTHTWDSRFYPPCPYNYGHYPTVNDISGLSAVLSAALANRQRAVPVSFRALTFGTEAMERALKTFLRQQQPDLRCDYRIASADWKGTTVIFRFSRKK